MSNYLPDDEAVECSSSSSETDDDDDEDIGKDPALLEDKELGYHIV